MTKHVITIFKDIKETETPFYRDVNIILERIKTGASKDLIKQIRLEKDKTTQNTLKQSLPSICFSGKFTKRNDNALEEHSGLICLDFDGYRTSKEMLAEKERLSKNKYVYCVFISPSGKGLKAIVKIPSEVENHRSYFNSLKTYFKSPHFDSTCKNVSRVCYESYDPLLVINRTSSVWEKIEEEEYAEKDKFKDKVTIPITDENKIVEILLRWWHKKYGLKNGERNNNVYVLASAFNDFGVNQSLAEYIMGDFASKSFPLSEIKNTIKSAYSNTQKFGSKYYEDEDRVNQIKQKLRRGVSKKEIRSQFEESKIEDVVLDSVINKLDEDESSKKFWSKNEKGVISLIHISFKQFLEDHGFYKYCPEGTKAYVFVRVTNYLIDHTSEKEIKDFVLNHLLNLDDISVYNFFAERTRYFREEFLSLLSSIDVYFIADSKSSAYLYFKNCAVKVTPKEITTIDYIDLGGYVWKDHVIDRNFTVMSDKKCDYMQFISNICGADQERIKAMESTIGYLMHGYKNLSFCPAVILNDEVISDNPEGGTGKGVFMNAIAQMKKLVIIDGKGFHFERTFAYQLVSADTQILCFDDVRKHFDFERLFSVVTEGLTLEKKNKDAIKIPFHKSPKVAITTNYAIKGKGGSFERRKWELELSQYYNSQFTPLMDFRRLLFGDWDDDEWGKFDNYMLGNLQNYLHTGLIKSKFINLEIRQLSAETCHEFIEWCGLVQGNPPNEKLVVGEKIYKQDLYMEFIEENPDFAPKSKMTISRTRFYKWLVSYGVYKTGITPEEGRDMSGRWIRFRNKHEIEEMGELDF
tara:strand:+ start:1219 stop:3639 length:2421 start_codon:yes stop_codon:yes gene_type:complete